MCLLGRVEKHKNGIFICAQADSVDIHKTEHYPTPIGFCLKFKAKWAFAKKGKIGNFIIVH